MDIDIGAARGLRILACWDYSQANWVVPLEGLAARGHEVIYLAFRTREEESDDIDLPPDRRRLYWSDFPTAQRLLRRIQPDCIVLMGTEGAWSLATVATARRFGIPTIVLQHAVFAPASDLAAFAATRHPPTTSHRRARLPAALFVVRSLWSRPTETVRAIRYLSRAAHKTALVAAPENPLRSRRADLYLVATDLGGTFHAAMDHVESERIRPIGLPEFDHLVTGSLSAAEPKHALLIDSPYTGNQHVAAAMTHAQKFQWLEHLSDGLATHGWRMTVKLHPSNYADAWPETRANLRFVRHASLRDLIGSAEVVMGFESTLMLPALLHRPGLMLTVRGQMDWLQRLAQEFGAVEEMLPFGDVTAENILAAAACPDRTADGRARLFREVVGPTDGRSGERMARAIEALTRDANRAVT